MQFPPNPTTELIVPAGVPFAPGFDVIGIGTELPIELTGAGISTAIVFYNSLWNPNSTTPLVKFMFIASSFAPGAQGGGIAIGFGICNNPSASTFANIVSGLEIVAANAYPGHMSVQSSVFNHNDNQIITMGEGNATGDGLIATVNNNGTVSGQLP